MLRLLCHGSTAYYQSLQCERTKVVFIIKIGGVTKTSIKRILDKEYLKCNDSLDLESLWV